MTNQKLVRILTIALALFVLIPAVALAEEPVISLAKEGEFAGGLLPSPAGDYPMVSSVTMSSALPESADLSDAMPPVRSQGSQASCVGWTLAYYLKSYQEGIEGAYYPDEDDELFSPAWIYNQRTTSDCTRDLGMTMIDGLRIMVNNGAATLATTPYDAQDTCTQPSQAAINEAMAFASSGYEAVFVGRGSANLTTIKRELANGQPVALAVPIYSEFYRVTYSAPVIDAPAATSSFYGGHAILIVGYDDQTETFKAINSWGSHWAESGFGYFTYDFVQREAWEGWVLRDVDSTAPNLPDMAFELGGAKSGIAQSDVSSPVFAWEPSTDPTAVYEVYWGTNANAVSGQTTDSPYLMASTVGDGTVRYLRVRATDAAGNASAWRTLFEFRYDAPDMVLSKSAEADLIVSDMR